MKLSELQEKRDVSISDGSYIGEIIDVNITLDGNIESLVVEKSKFLISKFSSKDEIIIKLNYNNQKIFDFSVKFQDCSQIGVTIQNNHVPIWIEKMPKDYEMKVEKDFIKVIQLVDGINTIVNINEKSGIPIEKINIVIYNLLNKNLIILNEAIKFTDTYRAKYNLRNFDKKLKFFSQILYYF